MRQRVAVEGLEELNANLRQFGINAERELSRIVNSTAQDVRTTAVRSIQRGPKSGRVYERGPGNNLSALHQASAPDEPPATDTGSLANSIAVQRTGPISAAVGTGLVYGIYLEFGTQRMQARPWLEPALRASVGRARKRVDDLVDEAAKGLTV